MLGYQSDAEKNGAAVALNSSLLSGDVSGIQAMLAFISSLLWVARLVTSCELTTQWTPNEARLPSRCKEEAAGGGQQDWGGQQPHS